MKTVEQMRLTAEQVRECIQHVYYEGYNDGSVYRGHGIEEVDWQAIADELNSRAERITDDEWEIYQRCVPATDENMAKLGWVRERTCHIEGCYYDELMDGCYTQLSCEHETSEYMPNYCPTCGARIVWRGDE